MTQLFNPQVRDRAIETTCSNLVMAELLEWHEVYDYMIRLARMNNIELAEQLCVSRLLLDNYYERTAMNERN